MCSYCTCSWYLGTAIPEALGGLTNLEILKVSRNELSGKCDIAAGVTGGAALCALMDGSLVACESKMRMHCRLCNRLRASKSGARRRTACFGSRILSAQRSGTCPDRYLDSRLSGVIHKPEIRWRSRHTMTHIFTRSSVFSRVYAVHKSVVQ